MSLLYYLFISVIIFTVYNLRLNLIAYFTVLDHYQNFKRVVISGMLKFDFLRLELIILEDFQDMIRIYRFPHLDSLSHFVIAVYII